MKQTLLSFLLALLPIVASADAVEIDGIYYNLQTDNKIAEVTYPKNITGYYNGDVNIPSSVVYDRVTYDVSSIGVDAFNNCSGLTSVTIPNSVTSICIFAFSGCTGLTSVTIPNSVTSIGISAFAYCYKLTSVTIPNSMTSIGNGAFSNCFGLTSVTIPNSVTSIGASAFENCSGLTSVTIPNSVTSIDKYAFSGCSGLTSVIIPNSVTSIDKYAFYGCYGLTSVTIPNSVISIGSYAFGNCYGLTSVTIPNSVTSIYDFAFQCCYSLTTITIGSGVREIYGKAFASCAELPDVYCYAENVPTTNSNVFEDSYIEYATLHVPESAIEQYKTTAPWSNFGKIVKMDSSTPSDVKKCDMPTISYSDGKLSFNCETEGAEFVTNITDADINKHYEAEISLTATYNISVYATKSGYENSDVATASLCWIDAEPRTEGIENTGIATVRAQAVLIQGNSNTLNIIGVAEGTPISVYDVTGKLVGTAKASAESTAITTTLSSGQIGMVKIGEKTVKVIMR